jgi:hypothetical protein
LSSGSKKSTQRTRTLTPTMRCMMNFPSCIRRMNDLAC